MWNEERSKLETELIKIKTLNENLDRNSVIEEQTSQKSIPIRTINYRVTKISNEVNGIPELKLKVDVLQKRVKFDCLLNFVYN